MEKIGYRAVIRFFVLKALKAKEAYEQLLEVYKKPSPSKRTVEFWAGKFICGRTRLEDNPPQERPKTATTLEISKQCHNIISENPSLTKREIANAIGISGERVLHILHGELHMKKLFGKLMPHTLTNQQKKLNRKQFLSIIWSE